MRFMDDEYENVPTRSKKQVSSDQLFDLIKQRTYEGKIEWTAGGAYTSKIEGVVPGTDMRLELTVSYGDQRDPGDTYSLLVRVKGRTTQCGTQQSIKALRTYILEKPDKDARAEAAEILESL